MLHTEVMEQIWKKFGQVPVDMFASQKTSQCPFWFSRTHPAPLGLDAMVQTWPRLRLHGGEIVSCSQLTAQLVSSGVPVQLN